MSRITQYSRISHHTITGSMSATFSVPLSEDFTDGSWSSRDLSLSEIGVNEDSKKAYIRINDEVKEIQFAGGTPSGGEDLAATLAIGNTTAGNDINLNLNDNIIGDNQQYINLGTTGKSNQIEIYTSDLSVDNYTSIASDINLFQVETYSPDYNSNLSLFSDIPTANLSVSDYTSDITDGIEIDPSGAGNGTGIISYNSTTGNTTRTIYKPDTIISTSNDIASTITDTITLDPQGLGNGTGIKSQDTTSNNYTQTTYKPNYMVLETSLFGGVVVDTISLDPDGANIGTGIFSTNIGGDISASTYTAGSMLLYSQNATTTNITSTLYTHNNIISTAIDAASTVTDTISIDPQGLGNGTGIKSEDTTTTDNSYISVKPTEIILFQDDTTNGQIRRITIDPSAISLVADSSSISIDQGSQTLSITSPTYMTAGASTNKISIGNPSSQNIISTETVTTTNNTITTIHTFTCVGSGPKSYKVRVVGYKSDYTKAYLGELFGLYNYDGTTVSLIGTLDLVEKTNFTTATSTISIVGSTIRIRVTGETATDINWSVYVEMNDTQ